MTDAHPLKLSALAKLVIALAILLIVAGVLWHGVTFEAFQRILRNLGERPGRRMWFRFVLQPSMAAIAAIYDGLKDVRTGRSPYFWTLLRHRHERFARLREGLNATARILFLGLAMDTVYQVVEFTKFYPVEALIIALLLGFVPYLLIRGLVVRLANAWRSDPSPSGIR